MSRTTIGCIVFSLNAAAALVFLLSGFRIIYDIGLPRDPITPGKAVGCMGLALFFTLLSMVNAYIAWKHDE